MRKCLLQKLAGSRIIWWIARQFCQIGEQQKAERIEEKNGVRDEHEVEIEPWIEEKDEKIDGGDDEDRKRFESDAEESDRGEAKRECQIEETLKLKLKNGNHEEQRDDD